MTTLKQLKPGMIAIVITFSGGLFLAQVNDASAATRCYDTIVNGHVVKRTCKKAHKYRMVCTQHWHHGVLHHNCHKVHIN